MITSYDCASCDDEKRGRCEGDYLHFSSPMLGRATAMHRERYELRSAASIVRPGLDSACCVVSILDLGTAPPIRTFDSGNLHADAFSVATTVTCSRR